MTYVIESRSPPMPSPGQLLEKELKEKGMRKSDFAEKMGTNYRGVQRWVKDKGFTPAARRRAAEVLDKDLDYFDQPDASKAHEAEVQAVFDQFLSENTGKDAPTYPEIRILRSVLFRDKTKPTINFYRILLQVIRGTVTGLDVEQAIRDQDELDRGLASKKRPLIKPEQPPPSKPRPRK